MQNSLNKAKKIFIWVTLILSVLCILAYVYIAIMGEFIQMDYINLIILEIAFMYSYTNIWNSFKRETKEQKEERYLLKISKDNTN